jgi:hypothetical protein
MIKKSIRLYNTVKFLKPKQVYYRIFYKLRELSDKLFGVQVSYVKQSNSQYLTLINSLHVIDSYGGNKSFRFLNLSQVFEEKIDWNYNKYGKLWTYNLTYFDFLSQDNMRKEIFLIEDFIGQIENIKDGMEPFPISLRGINWIKYLSFNYIENKKIDESLYAQYYHLLRNIEYHILGNHLLENAFSLLFGGYYFQDEVLYKKAKEILLVELEEQILKDGAHFELSPMYHQIMLFRLLDCINLLQNNKWKNKELLPFLALKASLMLGWLNNISYKSGDIPLFNDSSHGIAPTTEQLNEYAKRLSINQDTVTLNASGYRKISNKNYECIVDVGNIGAEYIPGHAHSDTFNFEVQIKGEPFIVDTGLSTYETNNRRSLERSTLAHNTVEIKATNQSEVWAGFRVANRAYITYLNENDNLIEATHDGYKKEGLFHTRKWIFLEHQIIIEDYLNKNSEAITRVHFHPKVTKEQIADVIKINCINFRIGVYQYAHEFNLLTDAYMIEIPYKKEMIMKINIQLLKKNY